MRRWRGHCSGSVLDQAGNLIGVVVSKLDALKLAERMGDLPQNVNFAIRGEAVRSFLERLSKVIGGTQH